MPAELKQDGLAIGRHRTARFMRDNGPNVRQKTRFKRTIDSNQDSPTASNLPEQDFTCDDIDQKWGVDISYVWTAEGWICLAIVLDLFSRRIIGWAVSERMKKGLAMKVLQSAIALHLPSPGVLHHSDRRSQYCSGDYPTLVKQHGLLPSMSGKVNCHDNAMVESMFKTIKSEPIWSASFVSRRQAANAIGQYIDGSHNPRRQHSSLGYKSPLRFEAETEKRSKSLSTRVG